MSLVKYPNYFSNPLEEAGHKCFDISGVFFKIIEGFNFSRGAGPTITVGKLLSLACQAHHRPQPGPPQPRTAPAPAAGQPRWGQCASSHPPPLAGPIGLKCLSGPLPPLFSPLAASVMIQLDSGNREIG